MNFKLEVFEGPLDLLLSLINKSKINIYDISVLEITNQFLDYIKRAQKKDMHLESEFIQMAALLLYIKSKMLLPKPDMEEVEELKADLVNKLVEYQKFKELSLYLKRRENSLKFNYFKKPDFIPKQKLTLDNNVCIEDLYLALRDVLERCEYRKPVKSEVFNEIIKMDAYTIQSKIKSIISMLKEHSSVTFSKIFEKIYNRNEAITTFLAFLELVNKSHLIINFQNNEIICCLNGE